MVVVPLRDARVLRCVKLEELSFSVHLPLSVV